MWDLHACQAMAFPQIHSLLHHRPACPLKSPGMGLPQVTAFPPQGGRPVWLSHFTSFQKQSGWSPSCGLLIFCPEYLLAARSYWLCLHCCIYPAAVAAAKDVHFHSAAPPAFTETFTSVLFHALFFFGFAQFFNLNYCYFKFLIPSYQTCILKGGIQML